MKKWKLSALALTLAAIGLTGCNDTPTTPSTPDSSNSSTPVSNVKVTFKNAATTVERGSTVTLRVAVIGDVADQTVKFTCEQEDDIIEFSGEVDGVLSVKIKGLKAGEAVIRATSVADPEAFAETTLTVIAPLPTVSKVWQNILGQDLNYTITSKTSDGSVARTIKVTEEGIVATDSDGEYTKLTGEDGKTISLAGIGIDPQTQYAFYLVKESDNTFRDMKAISTNIGLLNADNFTGRGTSASSWLEVDSDFYGLAAINPSWLPNKKEATNIYAIEGSDEAFEAAMVEALLVRLIAPEGMTEWLGDAQSYSALDLAADWNTSITVVGARDVSIAVEFNNETWTATLSDWGGTELPNDVYDYLDAKDPSSKPALDSMVQAITNGFKGNNYVIDASIELQDGTVYEAATYITENYYFEYYSPEYIEYSTQQGYPAISYGYYYTESGLMVGFTYEEPATAGEKGTFSIAQNSQGGDIIFDLSVDTDFTDLCGSSFPLYMFAGLDLPYLGYTDSLGGDLAYTIFKVADNDYRSSSADMTDELSYYYLGRPLSQIQPGKELWTLFQNPILNKGVLESIEIWYTFVEGDYLRGYIQSFSAFGQAKEANSLNADIAAFCEAVTLA